MNKRREYLYKLVLTAIFSALCFVGVGIHIPLPTGFIHLGNFICILAALLCGGIVGGTSGALGMGLYDLYYYGGFSAGVLRTILLKFGMGLIAGALFRLFLKKKIRAFYWNIGLAILFLILMVLTCILHCNGGFLFFGKQITIHYTVPLFLGILFGMYLGILLFQKKIHPLAQTAITATSFAILFNVFGEIYIKALLYYWIDTKYATFEQAYLYSMSGITGVAITSVLTCILVGFVFYPLYQSIQPFLYHNKK